MITGQQLSEMKCADIKSIKKEALADVQDIQIDTRLPIQQRFEKYLEQVHNPYCFRCGDTGVKIEFADSPIPLQEVLTRLLIRKKNNL